MKINDETFYQLADYTEDAIVSGRAPKRDSVLGILTRFFDCYGMFIPFLDKIFVNPIGTFEQEAWVYVHEVAHWAMLQNGVKSSHTDEESACNDIAFIILRRQGANLYKLVLIKNLM